MFPECMCVRCADEWIHQIGTTCMFVNIQLIHLLKDGHLLWDEGRKRAQFQWICTGLVAPRSQRLGDQHRRTAWWARHSKDTANDALVQMCLYYANNATSFSRRPNLLKRASTNCRYEPENFVLEINHAKNVTTVFSEMTASDGVSRSCMFVCLYVCKYARLVYISDLILI